MLDAKASARSRETEALVRAVVEQFEQYVKLNKKVPPEVAGLARRRSTTRPSSPTRSQPTCR